MYSLSIVWHEEGKQFYFKIYRPQGGNKIKKWVKILDTKIIQEIHSCRNNPELIDDEIGFDLEDLFEFDIVVIPVFLKADNRWLIVTIQNQLGIIKVTLYDRKRMPYLSDDEVAQQLEDISDFVHTIIDHVTQIQGITLEEGSIEGDTVILESTDERDMIPTILQISEGIALNDSKFPNESVEEVRHKITDRLMAFSMLK